MSPVSVCVSIAMLTGLSGSKSLGVGRMEGPTEDPNILQSVQAEVGHTWVTKEFVAILGNQIVVEL